MDCMEYSSASTWVVSLAGLNMYMENQVQVHMPIDRNK